MTATDRKAARAVLPREDRFKPRGIVSGSRRGRWRAAVLIAVHVGFIAHFAHWKVAGETLSPLEPSESMFTFELGYVNAGFVLFTIAILATLFVGRFLCGWLCHFVAYQDLCAWLLGKLGLRPRPVRSRLLRLVPLGAAFYMFVWPSLERWFEDAPPPSWEWSLTKTRFWETFPGPGMALLTILVDGFLLVWWLGAKGFCTYGCPYGAFFGVADRFATGRIRVTDACETCGHCTAVCTSNVRVHEEVNRHGMVVDPGCMKCLDCVSACPKDALYFGFGKPAWFAAKAKKKSATADFGWGEEIVMGLVFLATLFAVRAAYNLVPFLLALGLGALGAIAAIVLIRMVRDNELRFQRADLQRDGRLTGRGRCVALVCVGFLALVVHSGVVRWYTVSGERVAYEGADRKRPADERERLLKTSLDRLRTAESLGLVGDSALQKTLGLVQRELGDYEAAERSLRLAIDLHPDPLWPAATVPLTDLLMMRGARDEAESRLRALLEEHPDSAPARFRFDQLKR